MHNLTLTAKQTLALGIMAGLVSAVCLNAGYTVGQRPAPAPQVYGHVLERQGVRQLFIFAPVPSVPHVPVVVCDTSIPGDCSQKILMMLGSGWKLESDHGHD